MKIDKSKFRYYDPNCPEDYLDDVGGYHSPGQCCAPDGRFCGECNKLSCNGCSVWNGCEDSTNLKI